MKNSNIVPSDKFGDIPVSPQRKSTSHTGPWKREEEIRSHQPPEAYVEQEHNEDEAGGGSFGVSRTAVEELGIVAIFLGEG